MLIKRFKEDIKKWDRKIAELGIIAKDAKSSEKKDHEEKIKELSEKIIKTKEEIRKLKKKLDDFQVLGKDKQGK